MEAYIDESGDRGTANHGTRWLTFGCGMVADKDVATIAMQINVVRAKCAMKQPPPPVHFKTMTHQNRRGVYDFMVNHMSDWTGVIVSTDTTKILSGSWLLNPTFQYNYALRYAIERVSQRAANIEEQATIYIEKSRSFNLASFRQYLAKLRLDPSASRIDWTTVDPSRVHEAHKTSCDGLALADGLAHAGFKAMEPNRLWGQCELTYLETVNPRLWRDANSTYSIWQKGFVLMPTPEWATFNGEFSWFDALREIAPLR